MHPCYADVVFPPRTSQAFTYRIPTAWPTPPTVGHWVLAPFGPRCKPGLIVSLTDNARQVGIPPDRIRELHTRLATSSPWCPDPQLVTLAQWIADYYLAPLGTCLELIQPPHPPFRSTTRWIITPQGRQRLATMRPGQPVTATHVLLTALGNRAKGLAPSTIDRLLKHPAALLQRLKRYRWVQEQEDWTERTFQPDPDPPLSPPPPDSPVQTAPHLRHSCESRNDDRIARPPWWERFRHHLQAGQVGEMLTCTSSRDRIDLLVNVIRETMARQRRTLVITPNINLSVSLAAQLRHAVAGPIGEFHGGLSEKQRWQQWQAVTQGHHAVVVGTRSALFLPLPALGCVWVDHEEDSAHKEEASPHYHAREVARQRASLNNAVLVLHSPHPTLETISRRATDNEPLTFPVPSRHAPPAVQLVNLQETAFGTIFSDAFLSGIEQALAQGGGVIVYHNRKGFASSLTCRDCGAAPHCPRCQVSFSFRQSQLLCPYCGQGEPLPLTCPSCSGTRLAPFGFGTERLEADLRRLYPHITVGRYDGHTIQNGSAARRIGEHFARGLIPILVGTQMLFHAASLAPVRYLGVPYADAGLHIPDFRSSERVFHHLQQAMALCTPGLAGCAVIQTRLPSHPVMQAISQHQPAIFYDQELGFRERMGYPPSGHLIQLHVAGKDAKASENAATTWRRHLITELEGMIADGKTELPHHEAILGPLASRGPRVRGRHRYHLLIKLKDGDVGRMLVRQTLEQMKHAPIARHVRFGVNVDPSEV
ncbi:MAG: primosomal protein N' [Nitrospira sp.]|nr:primosomal protein N' [Nitrospira sp.]